jgi:alkanesulfonate monooxygenase SsuD/methylene tetrahydromethanopterin reductase-like flavin-dependent oxidoreductase (luciferase family)
VFQRFATLDAVSNGRAGSFTETFPLFGFDLRQYDVDEKLDLFAALLKQAPVTRQGKLRRPPQRPACVSADRTRPAQNLDRRRRQSAVGGARRALRSAADAHPNRRRSGVHSPGYVADTDEQAREELWPDYKIMRDRIGKEPGWPPMGRDEFVREADHGSLHVGSPKTVARKIAATVKALGLARFQLKYSAGPLPHEKLMRSIELYGRKVVPLVRDMLA